MYPQEKLWRSAWLVAMCLGTALPGKVLAGGYSDYENHRIWQLRQSARGYAVEHAVHQCSWSPKAPSSFSDEFPIDADAADKRLRWNLMVMLRLDQNARDLAVAYSNEQSLAYRKVVEVDAINLIELKKIFESRGFPTLNEVGEEGVNAMLMLVAHADRDLDFQKVVVRKMDKRVAEGTLPAIYPAVLKSLRPQITGEPEMTSKGQTVPRSKAIYKSGQDCYNSEYRKSYYGFLRRHYTPVN